MLAVVGIAISGYLTYTHYEGIKVLCLSSGGCETVQTSTWSKLAGVPVSLLGLIAYVVILITLAFRNEIARVLGCATALIGVGFSAYLTYRELFTIHAICQWCVASAIVMLLLAGLTTARMLAADAP